MGDEIVKKCNAFIKTMEKSAKDLFNEYETLDNVKIIHKDDEAKDKKKKYKPVNVTFKLSTQKVDKIRTGAEQATIIARNSSWTCVSAHMSDKARHVVPHINGKAVKEPYTSFAPVMDKYKKKWVDAMGSDLVNCDQKQAYHKDQYHLELKDGRIGIPDKEIEACYVKYVELTKDQRPKVNKDFEKDFKKKLVEIRKKKGIISDEEWQRREDLKNTKMNLTLVDAGTVFKNSGSTTKKIPVKKKMLPSNVADFGKPQVTGCSGVRPIVSTNYASATFMVLVNYDLLTYEYVPQSLIDNIRLSFQVKLTGDIVKLATATVSYELVLNLSKTSKWPKGFLDIHWSVDGPLKDDDSGVTRMKIDGPVCV